MQEEGFRKETSSSGARRHNVTACTAKMFCNPMEHSSEYGAVCCLARSVVLSERAAGKLFQPYLDRVNAAAKMPPKSGMTLEAVRQRVAYQRGGKSEGQHNTCGRITSACPHSS